MDSAAILLITASVALHVGWNAISKRVRPTPAFFALASFTSSLALTPVLFWHRDIAASVFVLVLPVLIPTGLFAAAYNIALARAYGSGDLSLVYPLARSLGPVGVALVSVAIGRGSKISIACATGIAIIAIGSLVLPLDRFDDFTGSRFRSAAFRWALATAATTVGYTLLDDQALRWMRGANELALGPMEQSVLYASMQAWATTLFLGLFVASSRQERAAVPIAIRTTGREALVVGIFGYASYILILASMAFVTDVTYVAAFRQLGIPLAVVIGGLLLRERLSAPRIAGTVLCTVGLLLIATSGLPGKP